MGDLRGGMDFRRGELVAVGEPPARRAAGRLVLGLRGGGEAGEVVERWRAGAAVSAGTALAVDGEGGESGVLPVDGRVERVGAVEGGVGWGGALGVAVVAGPTADGLCATSLDRRAPGGSEVADWVSALVGTGPWPTVGHGGGLAGVLASAAGRSVRRVICVGLDRFSPVADRSSLLSGFADDAALGLRLIGEILGARRSVMLVDREVRWGGAVRRACRRFSVQHRAVENAYPSADPTVVVGAHTPGRARLKPGRDPLETGVVLVEPWSVIRLARWVTRGRLDVVRPVFVSWPLRRGGLSVRWAWPGEAVGDWLGGASGEGVESGAEEGRRRVVWGDAMGGEATR
ncbi:MAG: hypothetical protein AAFY08_09325, partial [Planctomycetota bacterium]